MVTEAKSERWSIRVSPTEDMLVRRVLEHSGMSLNEYVVRHAVAAAVDDLADRQLFMLSADDWDKLQELLNRPARPIPELDGLLNQPSVLGSG